MTSKLFTPALLLLLGAAFVAGACTIGTIDDEDVGGGGGQGGETGSGGSSSGGSGQGGQGGQPDLVDCQENGTALGTPASTDPAEGDSLCVACQKVYCGEVYSLCNAQNPKAACIYGSTEFDGMPMEGEWDCMYSCFNDLQANGDLVGDSQDVDDCAAVCQAAECSTTSPVAKDLATCTLGAECFSPCFE